LVLAAGTRVPALRALNAPKLFLRGVIMSDFKVKRPTPVSNRVFVIAFRAFALLLTVWSVMTAAGLLKNAFNPVILLAYTIQSNILVSVFFGILLAKTLLKKNDGESPAAPMGKLYGFFPRLSMLVTLAIFVTMVIYWSILAPISFQKGGISKLITPDNLAVHLIVPLLMLADYIMFTKRGMLRKYDPLLGIIIPYIYLLEVLPVGLTHTVRYDSIGSDSYYPYIFLDIDRFGAGVILMVAAITLFFLAIAFVWRCFDNKLAINNGRGRN
jgi:hypothetical protein